MRTDTEQVVYPLPTYQDQVAVPPLSLVELPDMGTAVKLPSQPSPLWPPVNTVYQPSSPSLKRPRS